MNIGIIGITGLIGSGKDTIADYLCSKHQFVRMSFAGALKDAVAAVFNWDRTLLEGLTPESRAWRETRDEWWSNRLSMNVTPRLILQLWGTEVCRNGFHEDIWVASVENKLRSSTKNVVITDARFKNELESIKRIGGITVRVHRGSDPDWIDIAHLHNNSDIHLEQKITKNKLANLGIHPSEYSSVGLSYDHHIRNDGSLEELYAVVNDLLLYPQPAM